MTRKWAFLLALAVAVVSVARAADDPTQLMATRGKVTSKLNALRVKHLGVSTGVSDYANMCGIKATSAQKKWDQFYEPTKPCSDMAKTLKDTARKDLTALVNVYKGWQETFLQLLDSLNGMKEEIETMTKDLNLATTLADLNAISARIDVLNGSLDRTEKEADKDFETADQISKDAAAELELAINAFLSAPAGLACADPTSPPGMPGMPAMPMMPGMGS